MWFTVSIAHVNFIEHSFVQFEDKKAQKGLTEVHKIFLSYLFGSSRHKSTAKDRTFGCHFYYCCAIDYALSRTTMREISLILNLVSK